MAKRKLNVTLTGEAPMLMHNGQLADPLNKIVKAMKQITAKGKNKTEADLIKLSELEFKGGLYLDSKQKNIEIPSHLLEATVKAGAKATRKGKIAEQGVFVETPGKFNYKGPKTVDALFNSDDHRLTIAVVVQKSRIMRTRPKFDSWSVDATYVYDDQIVNRQEVVEWLTKAGEVAGIGDWRPRYGRFKVTVKR